MLLSFPFTLTLFKGLVKANYSGKSPAKWKLSRVMLVS